MHYEIAIEPKALVEDIKTFRYLLDKCGFHRGLLISEFPSKWRMKVFEASAHLSDMARKSISKEMQNEKIRVKSGRDYNAEISWRENAEQIDKINPFHAIIAQENPNNHQRLVTVESLWVEKHTLLDIKTEIEIEKKIPDFCEAVGFLLNNAKEVIFIDPFFSKENYFEVFREMLKLLPYENIPITYVTNQNLGGKTLEFRKEEFERELPKYIPKNMSVKILLINKDDFFRLHNRFILTDKGGIKFPDGLNILQNTRDIINIMDEDTYNLKYNETINIKPPPENIIMIVGSLQV